MITEQDKFSGMTRGLAKTGGRQSRGDSWVGVSFSLLDSLPFDILQKPLGHRDFICVSCSDSMHLVASMTRVDHFRRNNCKLTQHLAASNNATTSTPELLPSFPLVVDTSSLLRNNECLLGSKIKGGTNTHDDSCHLPRHLVLLYLLYLLNTTLCTLAHPSLGAIQPGI